MYIYMVRFTHTDVLMGSRRALLWLFFCIHVCKSTRLMFITFTLICRSSLPSPDFRQLAPGSYRPCGSKWMCVHTSAHDSLPCVHVFAREPNKPNSTPMINTHTYTNALHFPTDSRLNTHIFTHIQRREKSRALTDATER